MEYLPREAKKNTLFFSLPHSKDELIQSTGHSMSIGNLIIFYSVMVSYLIRYNSLLQDATVIITKFDKYFITLLQNSTGVYYKMRQVLYYKMRQFYCKMQRLLQIVTTLLQNMTVTTKCDNTNGNL